VGGGGKLGGVEMCFFVQRIGGFLAEETPNTPSRKKNLLHRKYQSSEDSTTNGAAGCKNNRRTHHTPGKLPIKRKESGSRLIRPKNNLNHSRYDRKKSKAVVTKDTCCELFSLLEKKQPKNTDPRLICPIDQKFSFAFQKKLRRETKSRCGKTGGPELYLEESPAQRSPDGENRYSESFNFVIVLNRTSISEAATRN